VFRIISALVIILLGGSLYFAIKKKALSLNAILQQLDSEWLKVKRQFNSIQENPAGISIKLLSKFLFLALIILFIVLFFTGFIPVLLFGVSLTGLLLILHVTAAPFFVICLMLWVFLKVHSQSFNQDDLELIQKLSKSSANFRQSVDSLKNVLLKLFFWLFLIFTVPAALSVILSMYPLFETRTMEFLADVHRYTVLGLTIIIRLEIKYENIVNKIIVGLAGHCYHFRY